MSDDRDRDRPKLSWAERDKLREHPRSRSEERRPRGKAAEARATAATGQYLKNLDAQLFAADSGGATGDALASAMRSVHGTPELPDACRAYREAVGVPDDVSLLSLFLDSDVAEIQVAALEKLSSLRRAGSLEPGRGLLSQIRMLAQDSDDAVATAAEDLLEAL